MVEIVETENFDIIAELAVDTIGKIKYQPAGPLLRRVVADRSRDRDIRAAARRALKQIGEPAAEQPEEEEDGDDGEDQQDLARRRPAPLPPDEGDRTSDSDGGTGSRGNESRGDVPAGPVFAEDTLGATERLTFALGGVRLLYDTVDSEPSIDGDVAARYERTVDRAGIAYRYGGTASVVGGFVDFEESGVSSRAVIARLDAFADARLYLSGGKVYGVAQSFAGGAVNHVFVNRADNSTNVRETLLFGDLGVAFGIGYGRVLDRGAELRLARIELALRRAQLLGRPITPDLAEKVYETWWALRGAQGAHEHLLATVALLREAGVLLSEPDASTTYKLLQILTDGQLDHRPAGLDLSIGIGETLSARDDSIVGGTVEEGRIETVLARARYARQLNSGTNEIVADGSARYRILGSDGDPEPWAAIATAAWRKYFYNNVFDAIGGLEFAAQAGASDIGLMGSETASLLGMSAAWLWSPNRASWFRLGGAATLRSNELFLGLSFEATYGLLDVGFIGTAAHAGP
jgi:hypothetical protein